MKTNTNGITLQQVKKWIQENPNKGKYHALVALGFNESLIPVNPYGGNYTRAPRGYRFPCGFEAFADLANVHA